MNLDNKNGIELELEYEAKEEKLNIQGNRARNK